MSARRPKAPVRILSWNVNGLRACAKRGFASWLEGSGADIVGIQEVRAEPQEIPAELSRPEGWHASFSAAQRKGYSGVGLYARRTPERIDTALQEERFDAEGRVQIARFGRLVIANVYFPNGKGKGRDNSRVPYKLDFYRRLFERLQRLRRGGARVLVMGDFNTAHREIDLARPRENRATSGFLAEECAEIDRWIEAGWIDTYRQFDPSPGRYTWWSQRFGVRAKNVGWRIDYVLASPAAMKYVNNAMIFPDVQGSDHCPVGVEIDSGIFG